jgi:hypothetical protein
MIERTAGSDRNAALQQLGLVLILLLGILAVAFRDDFIPGYTVASNDGPLGTLNAASHRIPTEFTGGWHDLNSIGIREGAWPSLTFLLLGVLGPVGYSKLYAPISLLILGLAAWSFFRQMRFSKASCILGGVAAMLNSGFFSVACWGVAAHTITIAMTFFAMAALADPTSPRRWLRVIVAGMAVGMGVAEGADVGAIFSVFVAAFAIYQTWIMPGARLKKVAIGVGRVCLIAVVAAIIAAQPVSALIAVSIKGVVGTQQDSETKQQRWDFATQWSLPKSEALALLIPGLFGYRMDTPRKMTAFESAYEGGSYWGGVGRDPGVDRAYDEWESHGKQGPPPSGIPASAWRFTGGGNYPGILVVLVSFWAVLQAFRRKQSAFDPLLRSWIWFWFAIACGALLLAFGRFAPFYRLFYMLPYASTIRNPAKFLHVVNLSLVIIFGFGIHALTRLYFGGSTGSPKGAQAHFKDWWRKASAFERGWIKSCGIFVLASLLGWIIYARSKADLEGFLQTVGVDGESARKISSFSLQEVGWFILFLTFSSALLSLILSGFFRARRVRLGAILLGALLVADLGRANLPWVIFWNYAQKYASNPVIDRLREKPYEHRVAGLSPLLVEDRFTQAIHIPGQWVELERYFMGIYGSEWTQHLFLYYNIQTLDVVQMPRIPQDLAAFDKAFSPATMADVSRLFARRWELTSTRYIVGAYSYLEVLNQVLDPGKHRFSVALRFDIGPKPGVVQPTGVEELTALPSTNGNFALFEFAGALPKARLYSAWEVSTNDDAVLHRLVSPDFQPLNTVVISEPIKSPSGNNAHTKVHSEVEFVKYSPNKLTLRSRASSDSILLLNDKYDPNWRVSVDAAPAKLLRANFIMRGVQLSPGEHTIEFKFAPPLGFFYVSLAAVLAGLALLGGLAFVNLRR